MENGSKWTFDNDWETFKWVGPLKLQNRWLEPIVYKFLQKLLLLFWLNWVLDLSCYLFFGSHKKCQQKSPQNRLLLWVYLRFVTVILLMRVSFIIIFRGKKWNWKKKCTQKSRKGEMAAPCMCLVFSKAHACLISTLDENVDFHINFFSIKKQYLEIITFCKLVYFRRLVMDIQWVKSLHHEKAPFFVGKYTPPLQKVPRLEFKKIQLF